jgi:predicted nucleic acid-binding protein
MRIGLDTNVYISAVLGGRLGFILDKWKSGGFTLMITDVIASEYLHGLSRPKFKTSGEEMISVSDYLLQVAEFVTPEEEITIIADDPTITGSWMLR